MEYDASTTLLAEDNKWRDRPNCKEQNQGILKLKINKGYNHNLETFRDPDIGQINKLVQKKSS